MALADVLLSPDKRARVVDEVMELIDQELRDKGGLTGMALKAGYGAVQGVKPGFVKNVVGDLLPDFAKAIEPTYDEAKAQNKPIADHLAANKGKVADALLAITDRRAERTKFTVVKGAYSRLRGTAKQHVESAIPRLGKLIERHAP